MRTFFSFIAVCTYCFNALAQTSISLPRKTQFYLWNDVPSAWVLTEEVTRSYNTRGQETESINEWTDGTHFRIITTYTDFRLTEVVYQGRSQLTNSWENGSKSTYLYDSQNRIVSIIGQQNSNGTLGNVSREIREYTGNSFNPSVIVFEHWDTNSNDWISGTKHVNYIWSTDSRHPLGYNRYEVQTPFYNTSGWYSSKRISASYDPTTRILTYTEEHKGRQADDPWVNHSRSIYTYDERMNRVGILDQKWNGNAWIFSVERQTVFTYNDNNVLVEELYKERSSEGAKLLDYGKFVHSNFQTFLVTGQPEQLPPTAVSVLPNPTTDEVRIALKSISFKNAQVKLVNSQGMKVYEAVIPHQALTSGMHVISTKHLRAGMYILHIITDNNKEVSRRVLKY